MSSSSRRSGRAMGAGAGLSAMGRHPITLRCGVPDLVPHEVRTNNRTSRPRAGSVRRPSAVQGQRGAGDVAGVRGAQPQRGGRDLDRFDEPFDRGAVQHHLGDDVGLGDAVRERLGGDLVLDQPGADVAGADAVAGDAELGPFQGDGLAEPFEAVLGDDVRGLVRAGPQAVHRGDVDDPAPAAGVHVRQVPAQDAEGRLDHHPLDESEALRRELVDGGDVLQAGVVDDDVGVGGQRVDRAGLREVGDHADPAGLGRGVLGARRVPVDDVDGRAGRGEGHRAGPADPGGGAGDQGGAAGEEVPAGRYRGGGVGRWRGGDLVPAGALSALHGGHARKVAAQRTRVLRPYFPRRWWRPHPCRGGRPGCTAGRPHTGAAAARAAAAPQWPCPPLPAYGHGGPSRVCGHSAVLPSNAKGSPHRSAHEQLSAPPPPRNRAPPRDRPPQGRHRGDRCARPGRRLPGRRRERGTRRRGGPDPGHLVRLEPGRSRDVRVRAGRAAGRRPRGGRPARLHPVGERLLRPLRLAEVRRPVGLRPGPAADRHVQQLAVLLQLVRPGQGRPRQGRGGLGRLDGLARRHAVRLGQRPGLRDRAVRGRRDDRRPARRLPGRLRRRRGRLGPAGAVRHLPGRRVDVPVRQRQPDARPARRQGAGVRPRSHRPLAAGGDLAGRLRLHRLPGQRHRAAGPVDRRVGHRADRVVHPVAAGRHHTQRLQRPLGQAGGAALPDRRHGPRPGRGPGFRNRAVRFDGLVLPGHHLLQLLHRPLLGSRRLDPAGRRWRYAAGAHRAGRLGHHRQQRLAELGRGHRRGLLPGLPRRHPGRFAHRDLLHRHRPDRGYGVQLRRRRRGLLGRGGAGVGGGHRDHHRVGRRLGAVLHRQQLRPGRGGPRAPERRLHVRRRLQPEHGAVEPLHHPHPQGDRHGLLRHRGRRLLTAPR
ncbi:hypothetical protein SCOCK_260079 [Actinacidiphila cocklensis]|uniref:Uncharacterized protein n=1 Tax=Actinacidiphila cocklensis TaxID=887465 RepID=A0A9W4DMY3_9ACTN|nr:hypothetical protein SCOCK_260079 [Actinacidiphila cocklensis]